jgi:site-specific DNA recombinase
MASLDTAIPTKFQRGSRRMSYAADAATQNSGRTREDNPEQELQGRKTALLYLRVSTKDQAEAGGEVEGFSIPAQRDACRRRADELSATVDAEFAERGESARSAKRPELQRMLAHLRENRVDYVIVHKVDRLARNRVDDVEINLAIQAAGAQLVSVTESIDETPSGMLLHGIMSTIAEFYSRNLANEVIKGSTEKAKRGGTVGKAPTGYRNVRVIENGREVRTVEIDPERGSLMRWAFEQYATGDWTMRELHAALTEKGLTSVGGPRTPSRPLSLSNFARLLRTPYYMGVVTYRGVTYPGNHEPLVSPELFGRVQAALDAHGRSGEKQRQHHHYLKGTVFCGQCGSRMCVMKTTNRHGTVYPYFFCLGRQTKRTRCRQRVVLIELIEDRVESLYKKVRLTPDEISQLRAFVLDLWETNEANTADETARLRRRTSELRDERQKLLQAYYASAVPLDLLGTEQARIDRELMNAERLLEASSVRTEEFVARLDAALSFVEQAQDAYASASARVRRQINQALFERIDISDEDDEPTLTLAAPFKLLLDPEIQAAAKYQGRSGERCGSRARTKEPTPISGVGSKQNYLVGEGGLEPPRPYGHWHLKPARLPFRHSPEEQGRKGSALTGGAHMGLLGSVRSLWA